jgi:hypothetical protein
MAVPSAVPTFGSITSVSDMLERIRFGLRMDGQHSPISRRWFWMLNEPLRLANFAYAPHPAMDTISVSARTARMLFWLLVLFVCNNVYFELLGDSLGDPTLRSDFGPAENGSYWRRFAIPCLMVPFCEESIFRLGLRNASYLFFWGVPIVAALYYFSFDRSLIPVTAVAVYFARIALTLSINKGTSLRQIANERFEHAYRWALWGYTLAFGFSHVANFTEGVTMQTVLFILPHTFTGLVLGYLRIKDGIWFALVLHGSFNFIYLMWDGVL